MLCNAVLLFSSHPQGSFLVYPIDEDNTDDACQITNGIPTNSAIKALVRVYIVKVPQSLCFLKWPTCIGTARWVAPRRLVFTPAAALVVVGNQPGAGRPKR